MGAALGSLQTYFEQFGEVSAVLSHCAVLMVAQVAELVLMKDHTTCTSRGFGFVTFQQQQGADACTREGRYHTIDDKQVAACSRRRR